MFKFVLFILVLCFVSCNSATDKTIEQPTIKVDSLTTNHLQKPVLEEKTDLITDENVIEKLLKYGEENPETILEIYTPVIAKLKRWHLARGLVICFS